MKKYMLNTDTGMLHIAGGCPYTTRAKPDHVAFFDTEQEAHKFAGKNIQFCSLCGKEKEQMLDEKTNMDLRQQILKELKKSYDADLKKIKELENTASFERMAGASCRGALSNAARNACEKRAEAALDQSRAIKAKSSWKKEMIAKYK